ncbi:MAG: hypothetical protein WCC48_13190 [Anaeromyxobacteraceae bacterium]
MCAAATVKSEIRRFLKTGESDMMAFAWPGQSFSQRAQQAHHDLEEALIAEVERRARGKRAHSLPADFDPVSFTRARVEPMVRGLFPEREWSTVLSTLERSVVFLLPGNIADVIRAEGFLHEAWAIANLYLGSIGARLLGDGAPVIVGMNLGTRCIVSAGYFEVEDRFADFVVHEVAHVFHNCKRERLGMRSTRYREWLLPIAFRKRETFAYACEAYSRIIALAKGAADRTALVEEHLTRGGFPDDRVDTAEYADILREAVRARNGWKRILARCEEPSHRRQRSAPQATALNAVS